MLKGRGNKNSLVTFHYTTIERTKQSLRAYMDAVFIHATEDMMRRYCDRIDTPTWDVQLPHTF